MACAADFKHRLDGSGLDYFPDDPSAVLTKKHNKVVDFVWEDANKA